MTTLPPPPPLRPIRVGPVQLDCPVVLAPMTGVSDLPFRRLVRRCGSGLNVTEMIASPAAIRETREETGIADLAFPWGEDYLETEPYAGGKVVRFYVAEVRARTVSLPINPELGRAEHHEYRWVSFAQGMALLVPRLQRILTWADGVISGAPAARDAAPRA